jgi:hypothetical protein
MVKTATPYQVKVGDSVYQNIKKLIVPKGDNRFQVWAPGYEALDTVINLRYQHYGFKQELLPLPDYAAYQVELAAYNKKIKNARIPFYFAVPSAVFTVYSFSKGRQYYHETEGLLQQYYLAPTINSRVYNLREDYETAKENYRKHYNRYYASAGITGALTITGIILSKKYNKKKRPVYEGDEGSPFTMTDWRINVIDNSPVVSFSFVF